MERARLNFAYRITGPGNRLLLEAETNHVCTNLADKPQRLPQELVASLAPYGRGV
jgi:acyl-CoA thioesterase FadM